MFFLTYTTRPSHHIFLALTVIVTLGEAHKLKILVHYLLEVLARSVSGRYLLLPSLLNDIMLIV